MRQQARHRRQILTRPSYAPGQIDDQRPAAGAAHAARERGEGRDFQTLGAHQFRQARRVLGRAGATVIRVNETDPVQVVLDRLDRLRGLRTRR